MTFPVVRKSVFVGEDVGFAMLQYVTKCMLSLSYSFFYFPNPIKVVRFQQKDSSFIENSA
jgi:hypothetical protein